MDDRSSASEASSVEPLREAPLVTVRLPAVLLSLFPQATRSVEVRAATVAEAMAALDARWPGMRERLCDSRPAIRRHINVFVDSERAALATRLESGQEVLVMTAVSGG